MNKDNDNQYDAAFVAPLIPRTTTAPIVKTDSPFRSGLNVADYVRTLMDRPIGLSFNPNINLEVKLGGGGDGGRTTTKPKPSKGGNGKPSGGNGGGGGNGGRGGRPSRHGNNGRDESFYQHPNRDSVPNISFSTNIRNDVFPTQFQQGDEEFTPIYILNGSIFPDVKDLPNSENRSHFIFYFTSEVYRGYYEVFRSKLSTGHDKDFTKDEFYNYTLTIANALEAFYCIDSILTYKGKNSGVLKLKDTLSAEVQSEFSRLYGRLSSHCINPNVVTFINYMYQNFSFGEDDFSPVIRLGHKRLLYPDSQDKCLSDNMKASYIRSIINEIDKFDRISTCYLRAIPQHLINLVPSCASALHDSNFCNFWHNVNVSAYDPLVDGVVNSRIAESIEQTIRYATVDIEPDGWPVAMSSVLIDNVSQPGMWKSNDDFTDLDYYNMSSLLVLQNGIFVGALNEEVASGSGIYAIPVKSDYYTGTKINHFILPGSKVAQSYTLRGAKATAGAFIEILFGVGRESV